MDKEGKGGGGGLMGKNMRDPGKRREVSGLGDGKRDTVVVVVVVVVKSVDTLLIVTRI